MRADRPGGDDARTALHPAPDCAAYARLCESAKTWDGPDATGAVERRGKLVRKTVTRTGATGSGGVVTFAGAYDSDGRLVREDLPGKLIRRTSFDDGGNVTQVSLNGQVTTVAESTNPDGSHAWTPVSVNPDGNWVTWGQVFDGAGRVRGVFNGVGAVFTGDPGVISLGDVAAPAPGRGSAADVSYRYDYAGRLTQVSDRSAGGFGTVANPSAALGAGPCRVRSYGFDVRGNRTSMVSRVDAGGDCGAAAGSAPISSVGYGYDSGDRPLTAGAATAGSGAAYTFDGFGRQRVVPAADTPGGGSDVSIGYVDTDQVATVAGAAGSTVFGMDVEGRRVSSSFTAAGAGAAAWVQWWHYTDGGDVPDWTSTTVTSGMPGVGVVGGPVVGTTTTATVTGLGGDPVGSVDTAGAVMVDVVNPHDDVVTMNRHEFDAAVF